MKKEYWIILVIILVLLLGYVGRHKVKRMLGMSTPAPVVQTTNVTPAPTQTTSSSSAMMVKNSILMTKTDSAKGDYLTDTKGMTLYVFDKDTKGVSNCTGSCLTTWPPYSAASAPVSMPSDVTTIKAADGTMMYAYKGMPLYYYQKDTKPGDTTGDGVGGVWHLAKP